MIKICYVVTIPLTIESFFIPQLQYLAANGFDVTVVCSNDSNLQEKLGESIRFYPIDIPRGISVGGSIYALKALTYFFKKEKFDLIQYSTPNAAFYSSIAAKKADCKVRNYHLMGLRYLGASGMGRTILKVIERIACHNSTSIECVSKSNMEMGIKEGLFPKEKVTVVWNGSTGGVDLSRFDFSKRQQWRMEIRKELGYSSSDFVYGFVGRITKDKGIDELLFAFLELNDNSKLLLVGDIEKDNHLDVELLAKAQQNSNIKFHSFVSDIERYYAAIDVLVLPSYREGFGNVVIEAGAVGTPAIVTDIPGPTDTIDREKTALVVPVKNPNTLAESLMKIRERDYVNMGENAAQFAKEMFDSKVLCQKILERKETLLGLQ
ncbi:glycosyltransferase family 4 protein [Ruminococcus sp.]